MSRSLEELVATLDLETLEVNLFRGAAARTDLQRVFGGQVAGQALVAAGRTVESARSVHSLHGYFLRGGDPSAPIVYQVERIRDGTSFSTRRVVALQHGRAIFFMAASFQVAEGGLDHADTMPEVPEPDDLPTVAERLQRGDPGWTSHWQQWDAIDLRHVSGHPWQGVAAAPGHAGRQQVWLRTAGALPDDPLVHVCALVYISDLTLLFSALVPHHVTPNDLRMASIDHAMWFHRPFRADEWLLYDQSTPSATGGRGLATGRIFAADGRLVASVVQEGLIRLRR